MKRMSLRREFLRDSTGDEVLVAVCLKFVLDLARSQLGPLARYRARSAGIGREEKLHPV